MLVDSAAFSVHSSHAPQGLRLDGRRLGTAFRVIDAAREAEPEIVRALCTGRGALPCVAHVVRGAVPPDAHRKLAERFWGAVESVGSHRADDGYVHVQQVGASQFGKSAADYVEQCLRARPAVESLFQGLSADDRARVLGDR